MSPNRFRAILRARRLGLHSAASLLGVSRALIQKWDSGVAPIPQPVALVLVLLEAQDWHVGDPLPSIRSPQKPAKAAPLGFLRARRQANRQLMDDARA